MADTKDKDAEPKRNSRRSINDYLLLRRMKPVMEMIRDSIGSTKVIKVPSVDHETQRKGGNAAFRDDTPRRKLQSGSTTNVNAMDLSPLSRVKKHTRRQSNNLLDCSPRRERESFMSTNSVTSHLTEYFFVRDTANGASATIYKSYQDGRFQCVAVKRIRGKIFEDHEEELMQMLIRERKALEELSSCPYITKFYEYVDYEPLQEHWMVMEFCDGGSAIDLLRSRLPLKQIAAIVGAVVRAIEFIHDKGYIHGDIKCANILLKSPGVVKVCDFGLASKVRNVENPDFHALGTVDYMSPEIMPRSLAIGHEDPYQGYYMYDRKIDIWAIGIVILELMIGHPPMHSYRRLDEDGFSMYISELPRDNPR